MTLPFGKCLDSLLFWRRNVRVKGQTTVEFALICLPFFAILFAIVDYAQIYFYENSLQNALRESTRFATAGRIIQTTVPPITETILGGVTVPRAMDDGQAGGREASRNECIRYWFQSNCVINIPLSNIVICSAPTLEGEAPSITTNAFGRQILQQTNGDAAIFGPGNKDDYIQVSAHYTLNTITPLFSYLSGYTRQGINKYDVHVSAIVKNEPALLNFQHTNVYTNEVLYTTDTGDLNR